MSKDDNASKKLAITALVGASLGYIAGILTAPKKGKDTRDMLASTPAAAKAKAEEQLQNLHKEVDELLDKAKDKKDTATGKAKTEVSDVLSTAKEVSAKTTTLIGAIKNGKAKDKELNTAIKQLKEAKDHLIKYLKD